MPSSRELQNVLVGPFPNARVKLLPFSLTYGAFRSALRADIGIRQETANWVYIEPRLLQVRHVAGSTISEPLGRVDLLIDSRSTAYARSTDVSLHLDGTWALSHGEFSALVLATRDQDVELRFDATLDVARSADGEVTPFGPQPVATLRWTHRLSRSDWQAHVDVAGVVLADGLLFQAPSPYASVANRLRDARASFVAGDTSGAMMRLREAVNAFVALDPNTPPRNVLRVDPNDQDPPELRARRLLASVKAITHLGPHEGEFGGRPPAELVHVAHATLTSLLAYAIARRADADPSFWAPPAGPERGPRPPGNG